MKMKKISFLAIVDYIFKFFLFFVLNIIWGLYFIKAKWVAIILSIVVSILTIIIIDLIENKKAKRKRPKLNETKHIEDIKNTFIFMPNNDVVNFFYKLASTRHSCQIKNDYVEVLNEQNVIIYPCFKNASLTSDDVIEIYNKIEKQNVKKILILCNKYDSNIESLLQNFLCKTIVLDYTQTYFSLLKEYEFYPSITVVQNKKAKNTFNNILSTVFNKKRTRKYIVSSLFIIFASFFVMYKIYYLIVATILLIFAILCQFSFNKNNDLNENDLIS